MYLETNMQMQFKMGFKKIVFTGFFKRSQSFYL